MDEGGRSPGGRPLAVLLRHGETTWSATGRHTGRTDAALTAGGETEAIRLRARVAEMHFSTVWCSPLVRARRTAELAGLTPVELDADLMEWDYGEMEGRTTAEIRQEYPGWTVWDGPWPGGETIDEVAARADRVVARVRATAGDGTPVVALVAHGHILRVVAARWLGAAPRAGRWLALETGTVSVLGWEHETPVIQRWNT
jgi:broad specificity phosphatase PhoE